MEAAPAKGLIRRGPILTQRGYIRISSPTGHQNVKDGIRQRAGLSQAAVAGAAGIGQTYIGQLERAKKLALLALADCCNQHYERESL